ncbi:MAG TPA: DUF2071 domain-containing protein [Pirellulales bacterium]|nr:DUF2071 domain-containing protein [Pirellulales bacterium]
MSEASTVADLRPAGYQSWHDLLFVHWRVPPHVCQQLLPDQLTIDTWQGDAWIGLVAFHMSGVRPRWSPAVPYLSRFPETNVRTYVRYRDQKPAVWFFSLEAARLAAVLTARWGWRLNYQWSRMNVRRQGDRVQYTSRRWLDRSAGANITAEIDVADDQSIPMPAAAGSLEEFLVERYVFYNVGRQHRIFQGRVQHRPYPLVGAHLLALDETLLAIAGIPPAGPPDHVVFSPGVDVEIVGLSAV